MRRVPIGSPLILKGPHDVSDDAPSLPAVDLETIADELRRLQKERTAALRAIKGDGPPAARRWLRLTVRYDTLLMSAARMLAVPTPRLPRVQRTFGTYARAALEAALAGAGLDVIADVAA